MKCITKRFVFLKRLIPLLLVVSSTSIPALAGSWQFTVTGSGSASSTNTSGGSNSTPFVAPSPATNSISLGTLGSTIPGTATSTLNVSIHVTGTWIPNPAIPGGDPAPPSVMVEETGSVSYFATGNGYNATATGAANNGLGDTYTPVVTQSTIPQ